MLKPIADVSGNSCLKLLALNRAREGELKRSLQLDTANKLYIISGLWIAQMLEPFDDCDVRAAALDRTREGGLGISLE